MQAPLFSKQQTYQLNRLLGHALTSTDVRDRLLQRDAELIHEFNLPQSVWQIIAQIQSKTLQEFCAQVLDLTSP